MFEGDTMGNALEEVGDDAMGEVEGKLEGKVEGQWATR